MGNLWSYTVKTNMTRKRNDGKVLYHLDVWCLIAIVSEFGSFYFIKGNALISLTVSVQEIDFRKYQIFQDWNKLRHLKYYQLQVIILYYFKQSEINYFFKCTKLNIVYMLT